MPAPIYYTCDDVVKLLKQRQGSRTQEEFAAQIGITFQLLSAVILGKRLPGEKILGFLGLRKELLYRRRTVLEENRKR